MLEADEARIRHEGCRACGEDLARLPERPCGRCGWRYHAECLLGSGCSNPGCRDPLLADERALPALRPESSVARAAPKASCPRRLAAVFMDMGVAFTASVSVALPAALLLGEGAALTLASLVMISTALVNEVVLTGLHGASLGKRAVGIKVATADGSPPGIARAFLREVPGKFLSWGLYKLGFLVALVDPETRTLHDRLAGTWVIESET